MSVLFLQMTYLECVRKADSKFRQSVDYVLRLEIQPAINCECKDNMKQYSHPCKNCVFASDLKWDIQ